jgi:hypothetical protein
LSSDFSDIDDPSIAENVYDQEFMTPDRKYLGIPVRTDRENMTPSISRVADRSGYGRLPTSPAGLPKNSFSAKKSWQELRKIVTRCSWKKYLTKKVILTGPDPGLGQTSPNYSKEEGLPNAHPKAENLSLFNTECEPKNPENSIDLLQLGSPFAMSRGREM